LAFVFIVAKVLFIQSIDLFFQNFSNRTKKNNQLDTAAGSQYFVPTSQNAREAFKIQISKKRPR
jgi:hypothetical protein